MGGAYATGAPWLHFAGHCNPQWGSDLSDWLAKMTGHRGPRGQQPFGQWGMFGGAPFGPRGGAELVDGVGRRRAAGMCARRFSRYWQSSR